MAGYFQSYFLDYRIILDTKIYFKVEDIQHTIYYSWYKKIFKPLLQKFLKFCTFCKF